MSRTIRFRFWSGTKMFYDLENVMECLKQQMAFEQINMQVMALPIPYDHVGQHGAAFMQDTGLKDKNGTPIYEGDILEESGYKFEVVYDQEWAKFKLKSIGTIQYPEWNRGIRMFVVGNIYANPEFLKSNP